MNYFGEATNNIGAAPRVAAETMYTAAYPLLAPPTATATPPFPHHHDFSDDSVDIRIPDIALYVLAAAFLWGAHSK